MAGKVLANVVQIGDSGTATQNFVLKTNVDGTLTLARGNDGATSQDILMVKADGTIEQLGLPSFQCRAWGNFNGADGSTNQAGNLSCVRNSTGIYTFTMATAMPDANYSIQIGISVVTDASNLTIPQSRSLTTTTFIVDLETDTGTQFDPDLIMVAVFR